jgi:type IV fimbrial biogenesis protein FimU
MQRLNSESGISLVDMLVSITVMGILAAIAVPNVQAMTNRYQLNTAGSTIASRLGEARTNSLKRNRQVWLLVDPVVGSAQVQASGGLVPQNIGAAEFLPTGLQFDVPGGAPVTIQFDAIGRPTTPLQSVLIRQTGTGLTRTVTVTSTGRISVS